MNVISYYQPIKGLYTSREWENFSKESEKLLKKWESCWSSQGWNPIVLDQSVAESHAEFSEINLNNYDSLLYNSTKKIRNKDYMKQCYLRWFAYIQFTKEHGDTVWSDYDVYNKSFSTEFFKTLPNHGELYCGSGSCGKLTPDIADYLLNLFKKFCNASSLSEVSDLTESEYNWFKSAGDELSDMYFIQCAYRFPTHRLRIMSSSLISNSPLKETFEEYIKRFHLFHIHGGISPTNKHLLVFDYRYDTPVSRDKQWDFIVDLINKSV